MTASGALLAFGPYVLDTSTRTLTRDGEQVVLGERHLSLLILFTSRPGQVIPKDVLIDQAWREVAVTTNSLDHAISTLRRMLPLPSNNSSLVLTQCERGRMITCSFLQELRSGPVALSMPIDSV